MTRENCGAGSGARGRELSLSRIAMRHLKLILAGALLLSAISCARWTEWDGWGEWSAVVADPADPGPYAAGSIDVSVANPETGSEISAVVWYPEWDGVVDPEGAPYPGVVFAHGFLANALLYPGNGQQLASWGYVVAMPSFPDERLSVRVSDARYLLTYLEAQSATDGSLLEKMVDPGRLGMVGHSLGGLTTLAVAARDARIRAAVALDPVNPPLFLNISAWDAKSEGAAVVAPVLVMGAPAQTCNYFANYEAVYPLLASSHKAKLIVAGGSHCDFMQSSLVAPRDACYRLCGGQYSEERVALAGRYTVSWLNYYLKGDAAFYHYLYGAAARDAVTTGLLSAQLETRPLDVTVSEETDAIRVSWRAYAHPIIVGYNVYRRASGEELSSRPYAKVGPVTSFRDTGVEFGTRYFYRVHSRDSEGNEHEPSAEVSGEIPAR